MLFLGTCAILVPLILVNLLVRSPAWSSPPWGKRGDHQDAEENPFAGLVTFWLTPLAKSSTIALQQNGKYLLTQGESDLLYKTLAV